MQRFVQKPILPSIVMVAALLFCSFKANGQSTVYPVILYQVGGSASESAQGIALDSNTNIYLLGTFASTTTINGTTLTNTTGWPDMLLVKFRFGPPVPAWSRAPSTDYTVANARIGCDPKGDNFVAGNFGGTNITFGTVTITNYSSNHSDDIFLAGYDTSGNLKHLNQLGGTSEDVLGDMTTDTNGNCYLTGIFLSPTFSAGNSNLTRQSSGGGDCFTAKYDVNGNLVWLEQGSDARGTCVAVDSATNCYVGGFASGTSVFDGLSPSNPTTTNFLAKYSSTGGLLWVRGDLTIGTFIKLDTSQNIYTAGTFSNSVQFGLLTLSNNAASTIYVAKYDSNGNALWARQLPGLGNDVVTGLTMDSRTNLWISGFYASVGSPSNTVAVIAQLSSSGNLNAVSQISSTPSAAAGVASFAGPKGPVVYACGSYATNFTFYQRSLANAGNTDIFYAWLLAPPAVAATTAGTNFVCSWPNTDTNLVLETSTNLSNWSAVTNHVVTVNGQNIVSNGINGAAGYFRLRLQ
jgi:hypothetical protein